MLHRASRAVDYVVLFINKRDRLSTFENVSSFIREHEIGTYFLTLSF